MLQIDPTIIVYFLGIVAFLIILKSLLTDESK
jgi:preprotein translocase subunit Sec61beta